MSDGDESMAEAMTSDDRIEEAKKAPPLPDETDLLRLRSIERDGVRLGIELTNSLLNGIEEALVKASLAGSYYRFTAKNQMELDRFERSIYEGILQTLPERARM